MCRKKPLSDAEKKQIQEDFKNKYSQTQSQSPHQRSWCLTDILYSYVSPILSISTKTEFQQDMHYQSRDKDKIENVLKAFTKNWQKLETEYKKETEEKTFDLKKPNFLGKCIMRTYACQFFVCLIMSLIFSSCQYINTIILYQALESMKNNADPNDPTKIVIDWKEMGILLGALVASKILLSVFNTKLNFELSLYGMQIKNVLCSMIMTKS